MSSLVKPRPLRLDRSPSVRLQIARRRGIVLAAIAGAVLTVSLFGSLFPAERTSGRSVTGPFSYFPTP